MAGIQHRVDGGVPGPDAVGEPVAFPGRRQGLFGRCGLVALFTVTGRFGNQDAQALAVTGDGPLGGLAEVVPQGTGGPSARYLLSRPFSNGPQ
ncbi:hypothetical protein ACFP50_34845, partial [Streptomyces pratens]